MPFTAPNGQNFRSRASYLRSLRGRFAGLSYQSKKKFPKHTYTIELPAKHSKIGNTKEIKDVTTKKVTEVTIGPYERKNGSIELREQKDVKKVVTTLVDDPNAGVIYTATASEGSRYTPGNVEYEVEKLPDGTETVNSVAKDGRIVSSSQTSVLPVSSEDIRRAQLFSDFKAWDESKDPEKRLSVRELTALAKELDLPTGGGKLKHVQATFEKRIREKINSQHVLERQMQAEIDQIDRQEDNVLAQVDA